MPRNVIVVGMARTGTSAIAAIFARRGYHFGHSSDEHIREGDSHNPFGYFEADDLIARNVDVLRRAGYRHHNTWKYDAIENAAVERIRKLPVTPEDRRLVELYERRSPWLWKDPRLCFTLPYWWGLMDPEETRVLLVRREEADTYKSFRRMGWCPPGEPARRALVRRIEQHNAAAKAAVDRLDIPHIMADYAEFKRDPDALARRLSSFLDVKLTAGDVNARPDLDHSTRQGRLATAIRLQATRLPRPLRARLERRVPERLLAAVFRERRYLDRGTARGRESRTAPGRR